MADRNMTEVINDLRLAIDVFSRKWNAPVLYAINIHSEASYTDISSTVSEVTAKMLSTSLTDLRERNLVKYDEQTRGGVYKLTTKGKKFAQILESLIEWKTQHDTEQNVVIIEDESMVAELYMNYLSEDYDARYYTSAEEALSSITNEETISILDRRLPSISGDEVAETLKRKIDTCLILVVSGVEPSESIVGLPIDDYLQKPVQRDDIRMRLNNLEFRLGLPPEERHYLAVQSKQRALRDAYGQKAYSMSVYTALSEEMDDVEISNKRKDSLMQSFE